jgi:hypothetical protein
MLEFKENRAKLKELILYISEAYASDTEFGATRLNKVLYFIDFETYARFGSPCTGARYIHEKRGPVPFPARGRDSAINELARAGDLYLEQQPVQGPLSREYTRVKPIPRRAPDMTAFSAEEMALANQVIETYRGWSAGAISKFSHQFPQWHAVPLDATIPYELVFVAEDQRFSEGEIEHGFELAQRFGWPLSKSGGRS